MKKSELKQLIKEVVKEVYNSMSKPVSFNGKQVDTRSIKIDGVNRKDYPDFSDAYISAAKYIDGTPLSDNDLAAFDNQNTKLVNQKIHDGQLYMQEGEEEKLRYKGDIYDREEAAEKARYNRPSYGHSNKSNMVGITFFEVPSGKEEEAKRLGLTQFKSGKFGVKHQFDKNIISVASDREKSMVSSAERTFGKGRYWEPKK
jgi:hypothetical protein